MIEIREVEESGKFQEIFNTQQIKYHVLPFKILGVDCEGIKKIYESIRHKYEVTQQLTLDPQNWNQNQRRVFIWFIIFYTYFHNLSPTQIPSQTWQSFSPIFFHKNSIFLHFQCLSIIKLQGKVGWTQQQDQQLKIAVNQQENGKWNQISRRLFTNSKIFKTPKHCRQRWLNHLDDKKKRGDWTAEEDLAIFRFVVDYGKHWCKLVPVLHDSRTEHMIKNRYNSLINKQRKSKKEREEHLRYRIVKILKKQLSLKRRALRQANQLNQLKEKNIQNEKQALQNLQQAENQRQKYRIGKLKIEEDFSHSQKQIIKCQQKMVEQMLITHEKDIFPFEGIKQEFLTQKVTQNEGINYFPIISQGYTYPYKSIYYPTPYPVYQPYYWI